MSTTVSPPLDRQVCLGRQTVLSRATGADISPELLRRSLFREVNERICGVASAFTVLSDRYDLFCECGRADCVERLVVPAEIYARARDDGRIYLVRPGHEFSQEDQVLDHRRAYSVVLAA
jgi:hypothetical protein